MDVYFKKIESVLLKLALIQFLFLILAQALLYQKNLSPYLSKAIFSEGVFLENLFWTVEAIDQITSICYSI